MSDVVLLKSDLGNLVATPSGIWLQKGEDAISVSWKEIAAAQHRVRADGDCPYCQYPSFDEGGNLLDYCAACNRPARKV